MKYEYKTLAYVTKAVFGGPERVKPFEEELNRLGAEGWELVNTINSSVYAGYVVSLFKRPVE